MELQKSQFIPQSVEPPNEPVNSKDSVFGSSKSVTEIQAGIAAHLAKLLGVYPDELDVKVPFDRYGLDSLAAIRMTRVRKLVRLSHRSNPDL
jgi:hypothetical protein